MPTITRARSPVGGLLAGSRIYITPVLCSSLKPVESAYEIKIDGRSEPVLDARESGGLLAPFNFLMRNPTRSDCPIHLSIGRPGGSTLVRVTGNETLWYRNLDMADRNGRFLGSFRVCFFSVGLKYVVRDAERRRRWRLRSDFAIRHWRFLDGNRELARIRGSRIEVSSDVAPDDPVRLHFLVAGFLAMFTATHWDSAPI